MTDSASHMDGGGCVFNALALFFLFIGFLITNGYTEGGLFMWLFPIVAVVLFIIGIKADRAHENRFMEN